MINPLSSIETLRLANPFCTRFTRPGAIHYRFAAGDSDEVTTHKTNRLVNAIVQVQRAAIVGPHGSGKSTLLQTLRAPLKNHFDKLANLQLQSESSPSRLRRLRQRLVNSTLVLKTQWRLWRDSKPQRRQQRSTLLVIDGFEQLSAAQQWRTVGIARCCKQNLLVTTHLPSRIIKTVHHSQPQISVVLELTNNLLGQAPESTQDLVGEHLARRDLSQVADVREFWFQLYDVVANDVTSEANDVTSKEVTEVQVADPAFG